MKYSGLCLRPSRDFELVGINIPEGMDIEFFVPESMEQIIQRGKNAEFIIAPSHNPPIGRKIIEELPRLKVIQLTGSGYDKVDLAAATKQGIPVAHAPGQNSLTVAQFVFIFIGVLARRVLEGDRLVKEGNYSEARKKLATPSLHEFGNQNLAILGLGKIGREVARIANFLGYVVGYHDILPLTSADEKQLGVKFFERADIFRWADILTLHIPLTSSTLSYISEKELKLMKPTAILIDITRGGIVDENALCKALKEGEIRGAALDVYSEEPPPLSHPYFKLDKELKDRLILSPHMGGRTFESNRRMFSFSVENVWRFLAERKPLECVINPDALEKGVKK
jgi:lactate dehydrogenase-like 2-hydroxyacid dehydrogenase